MCSVTANFLAAYAHDSEKSAHMLPNLSVKIRNISWGWNEKSIIFNTCWRQAIPVTGVEFRQPDRIKGLMLAPQPHNPNRFIRRNMLFRCGNLPCFQFNISHPLPLQESQCGLLCLPVKHTYLQLGHQRRAALLPHTYLLMNFPPLLAAPAQAVLL